jgi:6-phospho-3-hexuloisomerase
MKNYGLDILSEIQSVISQIDLIELNALIEAIKCSEKIVTCGAGRVGMTAKAFSMRLGHLGFNSFNVGDTTLPSIGKRDLFIVASGSGETQTIFDLTKIAKDNKCTVFAITGNPNSRIGSLADGTISIKAPSKTSSINGIKSIQPMTTLNEQSLMILFDVLVLNLMDVLGETHDTMWARHSNLE